MLRDDTGELRAFHNTCRHRGSQLCQESEGRLKARLITCPYHAWSYSLRGDLVRVPSKSLPEGFDKADHPLYRVALSVWRGFVFVNLQEDAAGTAETAFDPASGDLANWPLETLVSGHVLRKVMNCNWKIFWENFNECLHCPGVHKDLSRLVPIYGRGLMAGTTIPTGPAMPTMTRRSFPAACGLRRDLVARRPGPWPGLPGPDTGRARRRPDLCHQPAFHVHRRPCRLCQDGAADTARPGADRADRRMAVRARGAGCQTDIDNVVAFGTQVLEEDAAICEVNQKGLRSMRHAAGVLMPEEYDLHRFHNWVRERHAALHDQSDFGR